MSDADVDVLRKVRDWRLAGRRALLATVIRTWGSSPRPVGSIMGLAQDGAVAGSVSGGCIEDDLVARYTVLHGRDDPLPRGAPRLVKYGVSADEAHRFGLPCGGTLELLLEFDPAGESLAVLVAALEQGRLMRRAVALPDGAARVEPALAVAELVVGSHEIVNTFGPGFRMLLIGAGQLTRCVANMAVPCGFAVTVCDPRIEYVDQWSAPGVILTSRMPDEAVADFRADTRSGVIALSHDPKLDDLALLEALQTDAFYIGAIGSRRNAASRRARLIEHFGETDESLGRLRGPIGIYIASRTPPEIAVSIMAEVLAVKNAVALPREAAVGVAKTLRDVGVLRDA